MSTTNSYDTNGYLIFLLFKTKISKLVFGLSPVRGIEENQYVCQTFSSPLTYICIHILYYPNLTMFS